MRRSPLAIACLLAASVSLVPTLAAADRDPPHPRAQDRGALQDEEGYFLRRGLTGGAGLGLGFLTTDSGIFDCPECDVQPLAGSLNAHLGGMVNHRTALLGEYWSQAQALDPYADAYGVQHLLMAALQHWVAPEVWVKGGLGIASLQVSYGDGSVDELNHGTALMAAVGYEVMAVPEFALDIQLRLGSGFYRDVRDRASSALLSVSANLY